MANDRGPAVCYFVINQLMARCLGRILAGRRGIRGDQFIGLDAAFADRDPSCPPPGKR